MQPVVNYPTGAVIEFNNNGKRKIARIIEQLNNGLIEISLSPYFIKVSEIEKIQLI